MRAQNNALWMNLVRLAWKVAPDEARKISREINLNDQRILDTAKKLAK